MSDREKCEVCARDMAVVADWGQLVPDSLCWASISKSLGAECWQLGYERLSRELESVRNQPDAQRSGT